MTPGGESSSGRVGGKQVSREGATAGYMGRSAADEWGHGAGGRARQCRHSCVLESTDATEGQRTPQGQSRGAEASGQRGLGWVTGNGRARGGMTGKMAGARRACPARRPPDTLVFWVCSKLETMPPTDLAG